MIPVPLHEDFMSRCCGRHVCIVMKDGQRHIGRLTAVRDGKVYLNGGEQELGSSYGSKTSDAPKKRKKKNAKTAKPDPVSVESDAKAAGLFGPGPYGGPYGPYGPGFGGPLALDFGLIALLFLLAI